MEVMLHTLPLTLREHLHSDLQPYSCITESCNNYDQLFETREQWIEHELRCHHNEWWCDAPHATEPDVRVFSSAKEFGSHLFLDHAGAFSERQLPFLISRAKHPSLFPFQMCPFCHDPDLDLSDTNTTGGIVYTRLEKSRQLQKHIGLHIQNFSLLAFLEPDEENNSLVVDAGTDSELQMRGLILSSVASDFDHCLPDGDLSEPQVFDIGITIDEVPELENEMEWNFVSVSNLAIAEDDPILATFVEKFRAHRVQLQGVKGPQHSDKNEKKQEEGAFTQLTLP